MPFTLRAGDERNWRMGVVECVKHELFTEYPILLEKDGERAASRRVGKWGEKFSTQPSL